jgi:hypothetical protein
MLRSLLAGSLSIALGLAADLGQAVGDEPPVVEEFGEGWESRWTLSGLGPEDYRVRNGGIEVRVVPTERDELGGMLMIDLKRSTEDTLIGSVCVTVIEGELPRGASAGLAAARPGAPFFSVWKTNQDGYLLLSPGQPEYVGDDGEEGDPSEYAVKYWPATERAGPLRVIVRDDYAYFQVGPSDAGTYLNPFHSAILPSRGDVGFALRVRGGDPDRPCWVRFDQVRFETK